MERMIRLNYAKYLKNNITLNGERYEFAEAINCKTFGNQIGHYTAFLKNNEWMQFDDLRKKPIHVESDTEIKPQMCIYVKT